MKACLLAVSTIADDPRVRRSGDALAAAGHDVVAVGLGGAASPPPDWPIVELARDRGRSALASLGVRLLATRAVPAAADHVYWSMSPHRELLAAALASGADVYHANDWDTLPVAVAAATSSGGRIVYDSHELAVEESDRVLWRVLFPRFIRRLEAANIRNADAVITVAEGIADALQRQYSLPARPVVVRNTPPYTSMPFRPLGDGITVLYQGLLNPDKGVDRLIRSVGEWRPEFRLVVRGFGAPRYEAHLRELASDQAVRGRIEFAAPVPMTELVAAASTADVGIHPLPAVNRQTRYALPNKLFEYAMAGLALCVSGAPEMRRLVDDYGLGVTFADAEPVTIAQAVNSMKRDDIEEYKRHSLAAAKDLSWDVEKDRLLEIYAKLDAPPA
ncbi:MAG: glycosyltransferase family 4 protein [Acidimicrobiia bacterium]|nr:glycosyltransferase family 4 protein [Acidimicrobiia bacterium]